MTAKTQTLFKVMRNRPARTCLGAGMDSFIQKKNLQRDIADKSIPNINSKVRTQMNSIRHPPISSMPGILKSNKFNK